MCPQVLPLGENLSSTIIQAWLRNANRSVTDEQWAIVNDAIAKCSFPLFVKLVFDEICRWRSYTKPGQMVLACTIHETILRLYERIELQHGTLHSAIQYVKQCNLAFPKTKYAVQSSVVYTAT